MTHKKNNVSVNALNKFALIKSVANTETDLNSQKISSFDLISREHQLINLTTKILRISCKQSIHPRIFCRRWFGFSVLNKDGKPRFTEEQILAMESEHGYREKCINLIARLLKIQPNTIHRWGKGVAFDKIPVDKQQKYELYLGYVDAIRVITASLTELDENSLLKVLRRLESRRK